MKGYMKVLALAVGAVAILWAAGAAPISADKPEQPGPPQAELFLPPGAAPVSALVETPMGPARMTLGASDSPAQQAAEPTALATTYYRTCWVEIKDVSGLLWSLKLTSRFWYNYTTLGQYTPSVSSTAVWPYYWTNKSAWNSYWSYTVRFANGQGDLHAGVWYSRTWNLYIQEDAWGNCTSGWY